MQGYPQKHNKMQNLKSRRYLWTKRGKGKERNYLGRLRKLFSSAKPLGKT